MPPSSGPHHGVPRPEMQPPSMHYHPQQIHYQNGQIHYPIAAPQPPPHFDQNVEISELHKNHGIKRRFADVDGGPVCIISFKYFEAEIFSVNLRYQ